MKRWPRACRIMALLALAIIAATALASCAQNARYDEANATLDVSLNNIDLEEVYFRPALHGSVAVDKQTGVLYWISETGNATLLVDEKGRPRIWSGEGRR